MDIESELRLQAYLDGELPEAEARAVEVWLEKEPGAPELLTELRQTGEALARYETGIRVPESREFYWSKIAREIERLERVEPQRMELPWLVRLQRLLMPATALALLAMGGVMALRSELPKTDEMETAMTDSGAFTYRDYDAGATLIWLSYPSDNEVAKATPAATLQ
jgi:anti-sigma factor RsiW